jgi:signal transduction histidine kinase
LVAYGSDFTTTATRKGLGRTMVQATVDTHSGTVTARNLKEGGAEFPVKLPGSTRLE